MRTRPLVLALLIATSLAATASAAPRKPSPPTAQPDNTVVTPDPTPPPPANGAPTNAIQMQPIGSVNEAAAATSASQVQMQPIAAAYAAPTPAPVAAPPAQPPAVSTANALLAVANGGRQPAPQPAAPVAAPPPPPAPVAAAAPATPSPPATPPVVARVEQCLRAEAPRAARAETSAKLAVDLLIDDLCGAEVERASLYAHNLDALARFTPQSERAAVGLMGARVDPETGEIVNPPAGDVMAALAAQGYERNLTPPPQIRRFAAELVLALHAPPPAPPPPPARVSSDPRKRH